MKVLVTGGAGYIGSHTMVELLNAGHEVVCVDNFMNSKYESVVRVEKITGKSIKFYQGDICDRQILDKIFTENKIDSVINSIIYEKFGEPNVPYESIPSYLSENESSTSVKMWKDVKNLRNMSLSHSSLYINGVSISYFMVSLLTPIKTEPDFRRGYWGDSRRVIEERERKSDKLGLDDIYSFSTTVAGLSCIAGYRFTNDKLTSAKYLFENTSVYSCINDYEKLFSLLTKKYGDPVENKEENQASERQKDIYTEGELVRDGRLSKSALFSSPFSYIFISLSGGDGFSLIIEYYSIEHDNEREEDILMDL